MRLLGFFTTIVFFIVVVLTGCNSAEKWAAQKGPEAGTIKQTTPTAAPPNDGVRRVTTTEVKDLLVKDQAVIIDVRSQAAYDQGHIRGAKLIPYNDILNRLDELPKDKTIITYCS